MGKFVIGRGLDDFIAATDGLNVQVEAAIGMAIYEGAKIVADRLHERIEALPTSKKGKIPRYPTEVEKAGMLAGLGIAKKQVKDGFINVKIGMDGYNEDRTDAWPGGHPNALIFRSMNAGTSTMKRVPMVTQAVGALRWKVQETMKAKIEAELEKAANEKG